MGIKEKWRKYVLQEPVILTPTESLNLQYSQIFELPEVQKHKLIEIRARNNAHTGEIIIIIWGKIHSRNAWTNNSPMGTSQVIPIHAPAYDLEGNYAILERVDVVPLGPYAFDYCLRFDNGQYYWGRCDDGIAKPPLTICHPDKYVTPAMRVLYGEG